MSGCSRLSTSCGVINLGVSVHFIDVAGRARSGTCRRQVNATQEQAVEQPITELRTSYSYEAAVLV